MEKYGKTEASPKFYRRNQKWNQGTLVHADVDDKIDEGTKETD